MRSRISTALAVSTLVIAATAAQAADLPSRRMPPVYVPPPIPVFTWTGLFIGANAGAAFENGNASHSYYFPAGSIAGSSGSAGTLTTYGQSNNHVGFTGGGQIGYNYEFGGGGPGVPGLGGLGFGAGGGLVIGAVADGQYIGQQNSVGTSYVFAPNTPLTYGNAFVPVRGLPATTLVNNGRGADDFFGTIRGRLGIAFDRAMIYGTGGFAYNTHATGYTYGGGIEYSITNNVSIGVEYLRVNLNRSFSETATYAAPTGLGAGTLYLNSAGGGDTFNVARAVLNYRFTYAVAPPVVARY